MQHSNDPLNFMQAQGNNKEEAKMVIKYLKEIGLVHFIRLEIHYIYF
jgi:hypothetical protein